MSFPTCRHAKAKRPTSPFPLQWLGSEPYRLFFLSGILFSIAGVLMWPLFYHGHLSFYPGIPHARVMIEGFGGGFVIGFLGTAGPRMMSAPRLRPFEILPLFLLHLASGTLHLSGRTVHGDALFALLLAAFATSLGYRFFRFRGELPPPPLALAAAGLLAGLLGTCLQLAPNTAYHPQLHQLAGLLLHQGFLLGPIMGVGIFLFPRLLGGSFGASSPATTSRTAWLKMAIVAFLFLASFPFEVWCSPILGISLRVILWMHTLAQVRWTGLSSPPGTLANSLRFAALPLALIGLAAPMFLPTRMIALNHLLFIAGFGLICLIAGSRVLFGHSGDVTRFALPSWPARILAATAILAALTRASADFLPRVIFSHYQYAAASWIVAAIVWILWHSLRFFKKDPDEDR